LGSKDVGRIQRSAEKPEFLLKKEKNNLYHQLS